VAELNLEPQRTALVLIDLMPRIIALPTAPGTGEQVLSHCLELAKAVRAAGGLVVFVRVDRPNVDVQPEGSELASECDPQPGDLVIAKHTMGAFAGTGLDGALRSRGIDTIVLGGLVTNWGVESTGRAADDLGYSTVYVSDAMSGLDKYAHTFAVDYVFPRLGAVCTTNQLLAALT
jgi:nicotinamidase-related amidase